MLPFFPLAVLDEIWDLIESVSGDFLPIHAQKTKHAKYNLEGSTISQMMCSLENKALMFAFDYLNGKGIEVASLVLMGF